MPKNILTIGFEIASDDVECEGFRSKTSLLDWDIVLFKPLIGEFFSFYEDTHQGKPCLNDTSSFQLKECCEHWRREIKQAVETGKTVIVFLPSVEEVYIDTGERKHSGTGRNQKTTRIVAPYNNYNALPVSLAPINATGNAIKLATKGADVLAPFWAEFGKISEYKVLLSTENTAACLLTRNGDKTVGAIYRSKNSSGALVLLPDIDFYPDNFLEEKKDEQVWTVEATQFAVRILSAVVSLDKALHSSAEVTPEPGWASDAVFVLAKERTLRSELLEAELHVEEAQRRKEALLESLKSAGQLRALLFEKGKPLEHAIIEALHLLGFHAAPYRDATSEFDVVFECKEGRLIGESEGKDNKAINVDKLRQLAMNIHEDLQRDEVSSPAKGVLFGNGFRLVPLSEREAAFTEKCISAARSSSTALVTTTDLFAVAQYLSEQSAEDFAKQCRVMILVTAGPVAFPTPPRIEMPDQPDVSE